MLHARHISLHFILICLVFLPACGDDGYLLQSVKGHLDLMSKARPIDKILKEKHEPEPVREQLAKVLTLRDFAVQSLRLPDNGSYRAYADLKRPYAVWNMVVTPELSLELNRWCFPIVGCLTYKGYFDEQAAQSMASSLEKQGFDVDVYGVQAYSTLNWFSDPVLNTFLVKDEIGLAALLFHEMAHQVLFVPNDTSFNESFAKTVEQEGLRRWFAYSGSKQLWTEYLQREKLSNEFQLLLSKVRNRLQESYREKVDNERKRQTKKSILADAYQDYEQLKEEWGGYEGFDPWMHKGLNNARLASMGTYYDLVPAFQELLRQVNYDMAAFYSEAKVIGALPDDDRIARLKSLSPQLRASLQ